MKKLFKIALPILLLAVCIGIGMSLIFTAPKAERRRPPPSIPTVEVVHAKPSTYTVFVPSRGTISPRTTSTLIPEVSGQIVSLGENFREGGFFEAGELLLRLDSRDYENATVVAEADLAQAQAQFEEEQARAEQAQKDWQGLKLSEQPGDLTLRKPQLKSARASVAAAKARLAQAKVNLERTSIRAPYAGRVLEKQVDIGQYVSPGALLAKVYAVDVAEIRLPLASDLLEFVDLPESYRYDPGSSTVTNPAKVELFSGVGDKRYRWHGQIVRTEGAVDAQSQQLFVVAQVLDPYARKGNAPPLKIGQFVEALIQGRTYDDVFVLPRTTLQNDKELVVINADNRVARKTITVLWSDREQVVINQGLAADDRVAITALPYTVTGTEVKVEKSDTQSTTAAE